MIDGIYLLEHEILVRKNGQNWSRTTPDRLPMVKDQYPDLGVIDGRAQDARQNAFDAAVGGYGAQSARVDVLGHNTYTAQ